MGLNKLIQEKRGAILEIAARHGAYNVRLFGSWPAVRRMRPAM
jgi:hypothetical protein